jgi:hypothetical protein
MPLYLYACEKCSYEEERWMTIVEMEEFEKCLNKHIMCNAPISRVFRPKRHVTFHEDVYENVGPNPLHITSAQQLQDRAKKNIWI